MNSNLRSSITLLKDGEKYVFLYDQASRKAPLGVVGRFAAVPQLNFSWYDAAAVARKARELAHGQAGIRSVPRPHIDASPSDREE